MKIKVYFVLLFFNCLTLTGWSQIKLEVRPNEVTSDISPQMWGIFFEDINFAADGGLYAELVKNGSFQFPISMTGWRLVKPRSEDQWLVINQQKRSTANTRFVRILKATDTSAYTLTNEGYRGIGLNKNEKYNFSIWAKGVSGSVKLRIEVLRNTGAKIASGELNTIAGTWKKYELPMTATDTVYAGTLKISFIGKGSIELDNISLFPVNTFKNRANGMRADLALLLDSLKPGFVRFPGGCIVEGRDLQNRYQWKNTVGPIENRGLIVNRWNMEFARRSAPDYYQSFGLGFYEYFQLAEDLGAEPLPIINCGMACQFNSGEVAAMDELDPYIQDALDLIEFANGSVQTKWGKLRATMGHPAPFNLKMLGVGNEQWDAQYIERYKVFEQALKAKYPQIKLVAGSGPSASGALFDYAWKQLKTSKADFMDEHYYMPPTWFFNNARRYDRYDREGPKIFAGEYAAHDKEEIIPESRNTWLSALAEAAFMTGLERNADLVRMCSYAPLLAHIDAWQWRPDLIWFDNLRASATPNYYVQKLFSNYKGTHIIPVTLQDSAVAGQDSLYASSVLDKNQNQVIIKLVNASKSVKKIEVRVDGLPADKFQAKGISLTSRMANDFNSLKNTRITPSEKFYDIQDSNLTADISPASVYVFIIQYGSPKTTK